MGKHRSVRAALAAAALIALAGCSGAGTGTQPDVPGETSAPASTLASGASSASTGLQSTGLQSTATPASGQQSGRSSGQPSGKQSATSVAGPRQATASGSFAKANSIPFPVAVGNTWVYRTSAAGHTGRTTNRIIAAAPGSAGYQVTMSSTTVIDGAASTVQPVYVFYPDGTIGYPLPMTDGVSVLGGGVHWPDAAGLASGRVYHSTLRILISQTGQPEAANVAVQGLGTTYVTVPAGTYQVSVVAMGIAAQVGSIQVMTWIAQGVGPVKSEVLARVAGAGQLTISNELLSYSKGAAQIGS